MSDKAKITIPENIQEICREFGEIALKHELHEFSLEFMPSLDHDWGGKVHCRWEWGRHGDGARQLKISSSFFVSTSLTKSIKP